MKTYDYLYELGCFSRNDLLKIEKNPKKADAIIYNFKKRNHLDSVKRNLYVILDRQTKVPVANSFEIASKITAESYISHHSAFAFYGMTNQVFTEIYVSSRIRFNTFVYEYETYKYVESKYNFGIDTIGKVRVTDIERTIIDSIKSFNKIAGLEELLNCLNMVIFIDEVKMLSYLEKYNNKFLYQKIGYILFHFKAEMKISDDFFNICKSNIGKSIRYLYDEIKDENPVYNQEWQLLVPPNLLKALDQGGLNEV